MDSLVKMTGDLYIDDCRDYGEYKERMVNKGSEEEMDENISLMDVVILYAKRVDEVINERDKLKECVEYYANDSNWLGGAESGFWNQIKADMTEDHFCETQHCGGKLARQTLKELGGSDE